MIEVRTQRWAELDTHLVGLVPGGPATVLLHGFGAPGDDLLEVACSLADRTGMGFVVPEGLLALPEFFGGRAWWMIDIATLERAMRRREQRDLTADVPAGLAPARARILALLESLHAQYRPSSVVMGGFSQGAMLACDVALRSSTPLSGLVLLSGTLIAAHEWGPLMPTRRGLPVWIAHGRADPVLSFAHAERWANELQAGGLKVTFAPNAGAHEILPETQNQVALFLHSLMTQEPAT